MFSFGLAFMRRPDAPDIEDYGQRRKEALIKAHAKWEPRHARWQQELAAWERLTDDLAHLVSSRGMLVVRTVL